MLVDNRDDQQDTDYGFDVPAAMTDTGCERDLNEDRYAVIESPSGLVWIVCDGMGGVQGGELAAQLALDSMRRDLENLPARPPEVALKSAILEANRVIVLRRQNPAFAGMGTTVVSAIFAGSSVVIANVGDSRAYLIRDGAVQQLTHDHTLVQELVDRGEIPQSEALSHPQAHVLTRCIGSEPGLQVDIERLWIWPVEEAEPNDFLVLCSDGLYSLVEDNELATIVTTLPPHTACVKLVELAKSRGGYDNITVSIVPIDGQLRNEPPPQFDRSNGRSRGWRIHGGVSLVNALGSILSYLLIVVCLSLVLLAGVAGYFWFKLR